MIRDLTDAKTRYSSVFFGYIADTLKPDVTLKPMTISMNQQLFKKRKKIALSIFFNDLLTIAMASAFES